MLFDLANLQYWIFLLMGVSMFMFVISAGAGDSDADSDADVDSDVTDSAIGSIDIFRWLGVGKAPLMLLIATDLSLLGIIGWIANVTLGKILGSIPTGIAASFVFFGSSLVAVFTGSLISRPLGKIFAQFSEDTSSDRVIGFIGIVSSAEIGLDKIGQVDVRDRNRNLVTINAQIPTWAIARPQYGERVLIIDRQVNYQTNVYLVVLADSPDQDRWLAQHSKRETR